jgi:hypothetical protein
VERQEPLDEEEKSSSDRSSAWEAIGRPARCFPQMQERARSRSHAGGRLVLVHERQPHIAPDLAAELFVLEPTPETAPSDGAR